MIFQVSDNIITPLGMNTEEVYTSLKRGETKAVLHRDCFGLTEPFYGSLLEREQVEAFFGGLENKRRNFEFTFFEKLAISSAYLALDKIGIRGDREDVFFVLSTTKGNIDKLERRDFPIERLLLGTTAQTIGRFFGNPNLVVTVSNACTSGVVAQNYAYNRLKYNNKYRYAVIVGAEVLSKFVISGFQSFKALSDELCRPFDGSRKGLNLGEGAGTIILEKNEETPDETIEIVGIGNNNDANHISGPSRTGEGLYYAIESALGAMGKNNLSFINAHGTATLYNDDMESCAIQRSGLENIPVNSLKGYFGHTLGAAGVIESIVSTKELQEGMILPTKGMTTVGTVYPIKASNIATPITRGCSFMKVISGFGGSNAAIVYAKRNKRKTK